jgi:thiol-disulfide isomerase/thioredoxin
MQMLHQPARRAWLLIGSLLLMGWATPARAQTVRVVKLPAVKALLARPTDTTYVVNFWATWCKPCVEELPGFEQLRAAHATDKVQVILVSMDFASQLETKVKPFVQRQKLQSHIWLLQETDANAFIDQIDPSWSGALPFTIVFNNARQHRQVFERSVTVTELEAALKK